MCVCVCVCVCVWFSKLHTAPAPQVHFLIEYYANTIL